MLASIDTLVLIAAKFYVCDALVVLFGHPNISRDQNHSQTQTLYTLLLVNTSKNQKKDIVVVTTY